MDWKEYLEDETGIIEDNFIVDIKRVLAEKDWEGAKIYFHQDLDGVTSALAMKELLKTLGVKTVDAEITQYGDKEHSIKLPVNDNILPVLVDFAHVKPFIKVHTDHHDSQTGDPAKASKVVHVPSNAGFLTDLANGNGGNAFPGDEKANIDMVDSAGFAKRGLKTSDVTNSIREYKNNPTDETRKSLMINTLLLAFKNKKIKDTGEEYLRRMVLGSSPTMDGMFKFLSDPDVSKEFKLPSMDDVQKAKEDYQKVQASKKIEAGTVSKGGKTFKLSEAQPRDILKLKMGENAKVGNIVATYGMSMGGPVMKGGYDRYTIFQNNPEVNYLVIGWPMGLVQITKNPDKPGYNPQELYKVGLNVLNKRYKTKWRQMDVNLDRLKQVFEKGVDPEAPAFQGKTAAGFKWNDLIAMFGGEKALHPSAWVRKKNRKVDMNKVKAAMDKDYNALSEKEVWDLRSISVSVWDIIINNSGGHRDITNFSNLNFLGKGYVDTIKMIMAFIVHELKGGQLKNSDGTYENYEGFLYNTEEELFSETISTGNVGAPSNHIGTNKAGKGKAKYIFQKRPIPEEDYKVPLMTKELTKVNKKKTKKIDDKKRGK